MRAIKRLIFLAFFTTLCALKANAGYEEQILGDWKFVKFTQNDAHNYCYIYTEPKRTKATAIDGEGRYIMIVNNDGYATVGVSSNFDLDNSKGFIVTANNRSHLLNVTSLDQAQTYSANQDVALIDDLLKDEDFFQIRSYSSDDKTALDYYSLNGFTKALKKLSSCS